MQKQAIPIQPIRVTGCGGCDDPVTCTGPALRAGREPCLTGAPEQLSRVLQDLSPRVEATFGQPVPSGVWLSGLHLGEGEAQLVLADGLACRGVLLAEIAFDRLRHLLPDTDIYVVTEGAAR